MNQKTPQTAFVLGAGLGTRLRPLTDELPKPLLPVAGRPMIESCFEQLRRAGVRRILVNTHWKPEAYARAYPENRWRDVELVFVHEPVLLETGGGLKNIEPLLGPDDDALWIYNGDIFAEPDLEKLWRAHADSGAEATLLLNDTGNVKVDASGAVLDVRGRSGVKTGEARRFSGISLVSRKFFRHLRVGVIESLVEGWLRAIAEKPGSVRGVTDDTFRWADLGTVAEYEAILYSVTEQKNELEWNHIVTEGTKDLRLVLRWGLISALACVELLVSFICLLGITMGGGYARGGVDSANDFFIKTTLFMLIYCGVFSLINHISLGCLGAKQLRTAAHISLGLITGLIILLSAWVCFHP